MPLELALSHDLDRRLRTEASRRGESPDTLAVRLLDQHLPAADRAETAAVMLARWAAEAEAMSDAEAAENAAILKSLDDHRPSDRRLFDDTSASGKAL